MLARPQLARLALASRASTRAAARRHASTASSGSSSQGATGLAVGGGLLAGVGIAGYALAKLGSGGKRESMLEAISSKATPKAIIKKAEETIATTPVTPETTKPKSAKKPKAKAEKSTTSNSELITSASISDAAGVEIPIPPSDKNDTPPLSPTPSESQSLAASALGEEAPSSGGEEQEDPSQAAFNPETGEINWDCPCLGGMAHGVCGESFKAAFSCFVYSTEEPKGQDCIEKFRDMQECFRAHPDVYGEEAMAEEEEDEREYDIVEAVEAALKDPSPSAE